VVRSAGSRVRTIVPVTGDDRNGAGLSGKCGWVVQASEPFGVAFEG